MGGTPSSTRWQRYARAFDEISAEADPHYSARAFLRCVRLEVTVPHLFDTTNDRPRGQRGLYRYFRNSSKLIDAEATRVLIGLA